MTTALFINPNWDQEGNDREERIKELNKNFDQAIELVYYPERAKEPEIDWNNPFYAAHKRGIEKTRQKYAWAIEQRRMKDVIEPMDKEQLEARSRGRKAIDQL